MDKTTYEILKDDIRLITSVEDERVRSARTACAFDDARMALKILMSIATNGYTESGTKIWINGKVYAVKPIEEE